MMRLELDDERAVVRVVTSPMLNVVTTVMAISRGLDGVKNPLWMSFLEERIGRLDRSLIELYRSAPQLPDFLARLPRPPSRSLGEELAAVRTTPHGVVRYDIESYLGDDIPGPYQQFLDRPDEAIARYCEQIRRAWEVLFAPHVKLVESLLQREVLFLGRDIALHGVAAILPRLHQRIVHRPGVLEIEIWQDRDETLAGRMLVLTPLIVGEGWLIFNADQADAVTLGYQAPGTMLFWERQELPVDERLVAAFGSARARVLAALTVPMTQTDLTHVLYLTNGSVAPQLAALVKAGLVIRTRIGRRVYYELSDSGVQVLRLMTDLDPPR